MEPKKLIPNAKGEVRCPKCNKAMLLLPGKPMEIVNGKLNVEDSEDRYFCKRCNCVYRRLVHTEYYQSYEAPKKEVESMDPVKLQAEADGKCKCPVCTKMLTFIEGQPVRVVDGKLNMKDAENHYKCEACGATYRRLLNTEYYQWCED